MLMMMMMMVLLLIVSLISNVQKNEVDNPCIYKFNIENDCYEIDEDGGASYASQCAMHSIYVAAESQRLLQFLFLIKFYPIFQIT